MPLTRRCFLVLALAVLPAAGCAAPAPAPAAGTTYEDALGRKVALDKPPRRVVSLAPANTEILFALGAGDRVVGVTNVDDYPPGVKDIKQVGGFDPVTMSEETILSLRPDLVVCADAYHRPVIDKLERKGVKVMAFDAGTIDDVIRNIERMAELTDTAERGRALVADMRRRVEAVKARTAGRPEGERPRVFYEVCDVPLMTAGSRSFLHQLVELGGGRNIYGDLEKQYPTVIDEVTVRRNPEVILCPAQGDTQARRDAISKRGGWRDVAAVKNGRVHFLDESTASRPGPRLVEALEQIEKVLNPTE